jgi:predicted helicase
VEKRNVDGIEWDALAPDEKSRWITQGLREEFDTFPALGTKDAKSTRQERDVTDAIFWRYSLGVNSARDSWVYGFDVTSLRNRVRQTIDIYNGEVDRWKRRGASDASIDDFVLYDDTRIKWSRDLKVDLQRGHYITFDTARIREGMYRPFCKEWFYLDRILNEEVYQFPQIFPTSDSERENEVIVVGGYGRKHFAAFASNRIPNLNFYADPAQCFPYYVYDEYGSNRRENITDWALVRFREAYGQEVTKRDIFHYVYGLLHHPTYRERYAENLKRELPRIPLVQSAVGFQRCVEIGRQLMELHLTYERQPEYQLRWVEHPEDSPDGRVTFQVSKKAMKLSPDNTALVVNETLTLEGIPADCFEYWLGNRSALGWVIDQYQISEDKRSHIVSDPNRPDDPQYVCRLVGQVVTVSVETVRLVRALAAGVALPEPAAIEVAAN